MSKRVIAGLGAAVVLFFSAGCASTGHASLKNDWKDPKWSGSKAKKILAVVMTNDPGMRQDLEDAFQKEGVGVPAEIVASHRLMPSIKDVSREEIMALVRREGFDRVIFARSVKGSGTTGEQIYTGDAYTEVGSGMYSDPWSYWNSSMVVVYSPTDPPPSLALYGAITVETMFFDTAGEGSLIWKSSTRVTSSRETGKAGTEYAHTIVRRLGQLGLV